jgi:hypothetical protein
MAKAQAASSLVNMQAITQTAPRASAELMMTGENKGITMI